MALRLNVESQNRIRRYCLSEGENRLGSSPDCPVRLAHPSISRQHALIFVDGERAEIEDLGSRNGTRINGHRVLERRHLGIGETVTLGSVKAQLEHVSEKDLEAAVKFQRSSPKPITYEPDPQNWTTLRLGSLQTFTLEFLPPLLSRLAEGHGAMAMAQGVGGALFKSLPCLEVEIASAACDGVFYKARREVEVAMDPFVAETESRPYRVRITFLNRQQARSYRPLLECGALLIRLAAGINGSAPRALKPPSKLPSLPDPETLEPRVRQIYADAGRVAQGDIGVLICGESGTGKEVLARYLHTAAPRAAKAFVALNCAALPRDLLESELFGIESGVATGVESRPGKFEMADGGTLFLDEIGDMALETQARILRVLQEGEVYRLGGQKPRSADVRVVAATHRDLEQMMEAGSFRSDLYHRIADWTVELPPLRERRSDIANLAAYFLDQESQRRGIAIAGISRGAMDLLESYRWPGNIRQLEREMARVALFLDDGELLESSHLKEAIRRAAAGSTTSLKERLEQVEKAEITRALAQHAWSVPAVAKELRLGVSTLYRRMRDLDIETPD